ncbi:hypothetical protein [Pueribacillus sp. YX66]
MAEVGGSYLIWLWLQKASLSIWV